MLVYHEARKLKSFMRPAAHSMFLPALEGYIKNWLV